MATVAMKGRGGLALLVIVGVLGVMAILAVAFLSLARLERKASQQRLCATKALLLARSGLEDALARLSAGQDPAGSGSRYAGEDWDGSGTLNGFEAGQEAFIPGILNTADCPVRYALRPSFFVRSGTDLGADGLPAPVRAVVDGRQRGYSGRFAFGGGTESLYSLKLEDESGKINVNGGFLDGLDRDGDGVLDYHDPDVRTFPADPTDTGLGWNFQLARILNILGQQPELGIANPSLGTQALQNRPPGGYHSIPQLQQALGIPLSRDLSPYLTVSSWSDTKVLHPNAHQGPSMAMAVSDLKKLRRALRPEERGRPPVNLNTASRPVLVALLSGLRGSAWAIFDPKTLEISPAAAASIASALIDFRSGRDPSGCFSAAGLVPGTFRAWSQFGAFCDSLVPSVLSGSPISEGGNLCWADLLKANFDPNADLNKQIPDQLLWKWLDKSDLLVWSSEGSLDPTGTYRVTSVGRWIDRQGRLLAEVRQSQVVEAWRFLRQTTQRDFVGGRRPDGGALSSLSLSTVPWLKTTGASASWNTGAWNQPGVGLAVTTYPAPPTALSSQASILEGYVGLATVDLDTAPFQGHPPLFLHHFDDSWDADVGAAPARIVPAPMLPACDALLQSDLAASQWPDPALPFPQNEPNTLYPDGMHAQRGRTPAYDAPANLPAPTFPAGVLSDHGVVSYWVKPAQIASQLAFIDFSYTRLPGTGTSQTVATGRTGKTLPWGLLVENSAHPFDDSRERQYCQSPLSPRLPCARWRLVTARWDTGQANWSQGYDAFLDLKGVGAAAMADPSGGGYGKSFSTLTENLLQPGTVFVLGCRDDAPQMKYSNQVLDEFALYDFGDQAGPALALCAQLAARRYQDGRYYRGGDGSFLSTVMQADPAEPGRLLQVRWTEYLPKENRQEMVPLSGVAGVPRVLDAVLGRAHVDLDLLDEAGGLLTGGLAQGSGWSRSLKRWRYRVRIDANPVDPLSGASDRVNQPVLETPFFDDITFAWQRSQGPRVLSWD